ncbi:MAG: PSD1 and planctomycete cytochrome C domain-containing protein [Planctomycetota bacterium]
MASVVAVGGGGVAGRARAAEPAAPSFSRDVLPILAANCFSCHGFDEHARQAGLRLDTAAGATALLDSGQRAIAPHAPGESEALKRIGAADADLVMPPPETGRTLSASERDTLVRWIATGAPYESHWAFRPPVAVAPPVVAGVDHPIDRFLAAAWQREGLAAAPQASPETLLRRASLDLVGLPPTVTEIDEFLAAWQRDPEVAWGALVDRLLASPHYGERQARGWLDMARYADSNGYSIDAPREIWPWRDWVVGAFNDDMPFDTFTVEQLAGDLLPGATLPQRVATGFHRNTQINEEGGVDKEQYRIESVFDRVATTGVVWLGLTIGCAQCHDHKFDPVSQRDYYRLFAFFNDQNEPKLKVAAPGVDLAALTAERDAARGAVSAYVAARQAELDDWEQGASAEVRAALPKPAAAALAVEPAKRSAEQRRILFAAGAGAADQEFRALNERFTELEGKVAAGPTTLVLEELKQPRSTRILVQGDFTRPADEVAPGTPSVLPPLTADRARPTRLDLARWLVAPDNPLTARVAVNRVWQRLFGRGLVETDSDFGLTGAPPLHPELLDWLALEFRTRGWSVKELHRLIMSSRAYRMSSVARPESRAADPGNRWVARQQRLRLDAELVRDVALVASGKFVPTLGGPPVYPPIPDGATAVGQVKRPWPTSTGPDRYRRGLYTFLFRASPPPALAVFDAPDGFSTCTRRNRSNTPLQALTLLNDAAFVELAEALAAVVRDDGIEAAFRRCTGRRPEADEITVLAALEAADAARVLLNLDETVTRE